MFAVSPATLGAFAYRTALRLPVLCVFTSICSLVAKAALARYYPTPEVGQVYKHPAHKYLIETSYTELACPLVWGFGHFALRQVKAHQEAKGKQHFEKFRKDPSQTSPLKAATSYRNSDALYATGIKSRDSNQIEKAVSHFKEGLEKGHTGCAVALGQLCLAGIYGEKDTAFARAKTYFQQNKSPFSVYLLNLTELMQSCPVNARDTLFAMYQGDSSKFGTTFSTAEEIDFPILVANRLSLPQSTKTDFYNCALQHLKSPFQQGQAHYQLYQLTGERTHLEQAVSFEHNRARLDLALILRDEVELDNDKRALELLLSIPKDKRTTEISTLIAHFYLTGFGTNICSPTAATEHYGNAQPSTGPIDSTLYFDALAKLLLGCSAEERKEFCLVANEIEQTIRWQTEIPPLEALPGTLDLSLAIAKGLRSKLIDSSNNTLRRTTEHEQKVTLVQKLLLFSAQQNALPALTRTSAYKELGNLQTLLGKRDDAITSYKDSLAVDDTDPEPLMGLYALYNAKKQTDKAIAELKKAAEKKHPPAMHLYGLHLRMKCPPDIIKVKTGLFTSVDEEKENKKSQPSKDLILAAAGAPEPYKMAVTYCQQKGWHTGSSVSAIRTRSASVISTASTTSQAPLRVITTFSNGTPPPSYHENQESS